MKKIPFLLLFLLPVLLFVNCSDDETRMPEISDLPQVSQTFLSQYFPDHKIISVSLDAPVLHKSTGNNSTTEQTYIYALLEGNISVAFHKNIGNWAGVTAYDGLPSSATKLLDEHVYRELTSKEGQPTITALTPVYDHSIRITLANQHTYVQTQLLAYSGTTLAEVVTTDDNNVKKIADFLTRNKLTVASLSDQLFKLTEEEGVAYRLFIGNAFVISFNENADWIHATINETSTTVKQAEALLNKIAKNELPPSIIDAFNGIDNAGNIRIIALYGDGNYGLRFTNKDFLVNESAGIITSLGEIPRRMISDYYDASSYTLLYPDGMTFVGAYNYESTFIYKGKENDVSIEVDINGHWTMVRSYFIQNGKAIFISLPSPIINELPAPAIAYLNKNYPNKDLYTLLHNEKGYRVYVDKRYVLSFDEDGSFKSMVEMGESL